MSKTVAVIAAVLAAVLMTGPVLAQEALVLADASPAEVAPTDPAVPVEIATPVAGTNAAPASATVPRLTEVVLEIMADLSSNLNQPGDSFPIRLLMPVLVDGVEVLPAGIIGMGEVVHAKRSGGMGSAGEMLLTARYLEHDGQRIELRSFAVGAEAQSRIDLVNQINVASAAAIPGLGLVGFFIQGDALQIAQGTPAIAKLTNNELIALPQSMPLATPPAEQAVALAEPTITEILQTTSEGDQE